MKVTDAMVRAATESCARDDEGEFPSLGDLLGFSGENKTRTVVRAALEAAAVTPLSTDDIETIKALITDWGFEYSLSANCGKVAALAHKLGAPVPFTCDD